MGNLALKLEDYTVYAGKPLTEVEHWQYRLGGTTYTLPNLGVLVKIVGLGHANLRLHRHATLPEPPPAPQPVDLDGPVPHAPALSRDDGRHAYATDAIVTLTQDVEDEQSFWRTRAGQAVRGFFHGSRWQSVLSWWQKHLTMERERRLGAGARHDRTSDLALLFNCLKMHPLFSSHPLVHEFAAAEEGALLQAYLRGRDVNAAADGAVWRRTSRKWTDVDKAALAVGQRGWATRAMHALPRVHTDGTAVVDARHVRTRDDVFVATPERRLGAEHQLFAVGRRLIDAPARLVAYTGRRIPSLAHCIVVAVEAETGRWAVDAASTRLPAEGWTPTTPVLLLAADAKYPSLDTRASPDRACRYLLNLRRDEDAPPLLWVTRPLFVPGGLPLDAATLAEAEVADTKVARSLQPVGIAADAPLQLGGGGAGEEVEAIVLPDGRRVANVDAPPLALTELDVGRTLHLEVREGTVRAVALSDEAAAVCTPDLMWQPVAAAPVPPDAKRDGCATFAVVAVSRTSVTLAATTEAGGARATLPNLALAARFQRDKPRVHRATVDQPVREAARLLADDAAYDNVLPRTLPEGLAVPPAYRKRVADASSATLRDLHVVQNDGAEGPSTLAPKSVVYASDPQLAQPGQRVRRAQLQVHSPRYDPTTETALLLAADGTAPCAPVVEAAGGDVDVRLARTPVEGTRLFGLDALQRPQLVEADLAPWAGAVPPDASLVPLRRTPDGMEVDREGLPRVFTARRTARRVDLTRLRVVDGSVAPTAFEVVDDDDQNRRGDDAEVLHPRRRRFLRPHELPDAWREAIRTGRGQSAPEGGGVLQADLVVESVGGVPLQHFWEVAADGTGADYVELKVPIFTHAVGGAAASRRFRTEADRIETTDGGFVWDPQSGDGRLFFAKDLVERATRGESVLVVDPATLAIDEAQTEAKRREWQQSSPAWVNGNTTLKKVKESARGGGIFTRRDAEEGKRYLNSIGVIVPNRQRDDATVAAEEGETAPRWLRVAEGETPDAHGYFRYKGVTYSNVDYALLSEPNDKVVLVHAQRLYRNVEVEFRWQGQASAATSPLARIAYEGRVYLNVRPAQPVVDLEEAPGPEALLTYTGTLPLTEDVLLRDGAQLYHNQSATGVLWEHVTELSHDDLRQLARNELFQRTTIYRHALYFFWDAYEADADTNGENAGLLRVMRYLGTAGVDARDFVARSIVLRDAYVTQTNAALAPRSLRWAVAQLAGGARDEARASTAEARAATEAEARAAEAEVTRRAPPALSAPGRRTG
jgi:hypothetical protein